MADPPTNQRDRVFTPGLLAFLAVVAGVVIYAAATRHPRPDLAGAVRLLADGDLDRDERDRMLGRILDLARDDAGPLGPWAGSLAAVALQDEAAHGRFAERRTAAATEPPAAQLEWLDLGDPVLANVLAAWRCELAGERDRALVEWRQVQAQTTLTGNRFAASLAAAALRDR